jgi:hypothetical protein
MCVAPSNEPESMTAQKSDLVPSRPTDSPSSWYRFLDSVRALLGAWPVHLGQRWAVAKIRKQEIDPESRAIENRIKFMNACREYEETMARAEQIRLQAATDAKKGEAIADHIAAQTRSLKADARMKELIIQMVRAEKMTPAEAQEWVVSVVERIRTFGGSVGIETPELPVLEKVRDKATG